jgi:hypothetical protein
MRQLTPGTRPVTTGTRQVTAPSQGGIELHEIAANESDDNSFIARLDDKFLANMKTCLTENMGIEENKAESIASALIAIAKDGNTESQPTSLFGSGGRSNLQWVQYFIANVLGVRW